MDPLGSSAHVSATIPPHSMISVGRHSCFCSSFWVVSSLICKVQFRGCVPCLVSMYVYVYLEFLGGCWIYGSLW